MTGGRLPWQIIVLGALALTGLLTLAACGSPDEDQLETTFVPPPVHFSDVTEEVGLEFRHGAFRWGLSADPVAMMGGGICWLDYDNDGWLDLFAINTYAQIEAGRWQQRGGLPESALFRNDQGQFSNVSQSSGTNLALRGNGCVAADFDLDGWTDLYVTTSRVNVLLWNQGDGTFRQGAEAAGVDAYGWQTGAAVGDLNADGWPDLFVAGYVDLNNRVVGATQGFPNTYVGRRDLLYLNQGPDDAGRVTFREVGGEAGLKQDDFEYGLGALLSDLDGDGDLDLLVANDTKPNRLYENVPWPGGRAADPAQLGFRLAEVGHFAEIADWNSGMGVASGDYDGDGRYDLMITNMGRQLHSVYRNRSSLEMIRFEDATDDIGVSDIGVGWTGWGIAWADLDQDTDLDLFVTNGSVPVMDPPNDVQQIQYFANLTAQDMVGRFQDLTEVAGFNEIEPLLGRGSAMADYDNDGDLDVAVSSVGNRLVLLRNDSPGAHWLTVVFDTFYPGATVTARLPDGREIRCETHAGSSYLSTEDPRCQLGLGLADRVPLLTVNWPDGSSVSLEDVRADRFLVVEKPVAPPAPEVAKVDMETFLFQLMLKRGGARPLVPEPAASPELIRLGEALFWDPELSGNRDIACATCHHPQAGTGDELSVSVGTGGLGSAAQRRLGQGRELIPRNAPDVYNRGAQGWRTMFWDGRVSGTADEGFNSPVGVALPVGMDNVVAVQALFPVTSRDEMRGARGDVDVFGHPNELADLSDDDLHGIWRAIMDRLLDIPAYQELFAAAYPDVLPEWFSFGHAANAIAAYEMSTFTFDDSPWDRYLSGEEAALGEEARRGAALFYGPAGCSQCHNGSLLTDQLFHNIGVPQVGPGKGDEAPHDYGRGRVSGADYDNYAFRTPPLRNVTLTGPWMHNGAYTSLEAAVRHHLDPETAFNNYDPGQLDPLVRATHENNEDILRRMDPMLRDNPIRLTDAQLADLLAFLKALTAPSALDGCSLVPEVVPSGLPLDRGDC
ncbi:MAG: cytochrome c peroxidase [Candidatus Promineifilaceae bacterium]|nr:cytochrome c peroxidase [Candidatus Promineifilaceae bacterium]